MRSFNVNCFSTESTHCRQRVSFCKEHTSEGAAAGTGTGRVETCCASVASCPQKTRKMKANRNIFSFYHTNFNHTSFNRVSFNRKLSRSSFLNQTLENQLLNICPDIHIPQFCIPHVRTKPVTQEHIDRLTLRIYPCACSGKTGMPIHAFRG